MTEIREYRGKRVDNGEWVYGMPYADYMICGMTTAYYDDEVPMFPHYYTDSEVVPICTYCLQEMQKEDDEG